MDTYEKKYKEALEWARKVMQGKVGFVLDEVLEKFPELKESEDAKIRKVISDILLIDSDEIREILDANNVLMQNIDAWLEKQGEQKPVEEIEPTPIFRIGDILKRKGKDYTFRVDRIQGGYYHCDHNHGAFFPIEEQGNWELVEQKLRQKVQDALLKSAIDYYEAERACCEIAVPQQWKDDRKKAYDEFIWRCQDYQIVNESDNIDLEELNYNYL